MIKEIESFVATRAHTHKWTRKLMGDRRGKFTAGRFIQRVYYVQATATTPVIYLFFSKLSTRKEKHTRSKIIIIIGSNKHGATAGKRCKSIMYIGPVKVKQWATAPWNDDESRTLGERRRDFHDKEFFTLRLFVKIINPCSFYTRRVVSTYNEKRTPSDPRVYRDIITQLCKTGNGEIYTSHSSSSSSSSYYNY